MCRSSPYVIVLSPDDWAELERRARSRAGPHWRVVRARIVLAAAAGERNKVIAAGLGVDADTVSKWRRRYAEEGLGGLVDRKRSGRPRRFSPVVVAQVKAMACEPPAARAAPLSRWSCAELAFQAAAEGLVESVAPSTVRRWLAEDAIRPWRYRSWIFPRDPDFAVRAGRVLDLYQRIWDGEPLAGDEYVLSSDEKPGIQILSRVAPGLPPGPGKEGRFEFEYRRCGTAAYLAAYDVHRAHLMGRVEPSTGIVPFTALVDQVMTAEPYTSARRVFWVVDNGCSHRNWAAAARLADAYPNAVMVHLPVHASWLNQIEIVFSIIARKALTPADFEDADQLAARLTGFERRFNATARPFDWRYTRADLAGTLRRIEAANSADNNTLAA